jgi:apolipoprotein N-acyltransferase
VRVIGARAAAPVALAFGLGLAHAAAFAPLAHWAYALAVLAALFALLRACAARGTAPRAQAGLAFAFGLGGYGAGLAWLYVSMHVYGGMPSPMAAIAVVLFAGYLALYPAAAVWIAARWCSGRGPIVHALGLAGAFTLAELARGTVFTGFPWLAVGYAQLDGPLDRLAPIAGVFGVGAAAVAAGSFAAGASRRAPVRSPPRWRARSSPRPSRCRATPGRGPRVRRWTCASCRATSPRT